MSKIDSKVGEAQVTYRVDNDAVVGTLRGIQYLVDGAGKRQAVVINLEEWGELWEDFYDVIVSKSRRHEPTISWDTLKAELASEELKGV